MKRFQRSFSIILVLSILLSPLSQLVGGIVFAGEEIDKEYVYVTVENTTYPKAEGAAWDGQLFDMHKVELDDGIPITMMEAIARALTDNKIEAEGIESGYISSIAGLAASDGSWESGWMGTLNDWFTDIGFNGIEVEDGDIIKVMFTSNGFGADLGGEWGNEDTTLKALSFDDGELTPEFNSDITEYSLIIDKDIIEVLVTPTASNKNYQVRTYLNDYAPSTTGYKRTQAIPVENGDKIIIGVGDSLWPSMNNSTETTKYTITVESIKANTPSEQLEKNLAYLVGTVTNPTFGMLGGEWTILSLARGGYEVPEGYYDSYYNNVVNKVIELMPKDGSKPEGRLDKNKGTEHSRLIIGLTSIAKDVTDVGSYNILEAMADYNYMIRQGINGPIFALIALDAHDYQIHQVEGVAIQSTREMFIDYILDKEIKKGTEDAGGWALTGTNPDPDITAMAIQGLTAYYDTNEEVKAAVDRGIKCLSDIQRTDGGYASWGTVNAESIAQVVVALTGLEIDPHTDERFIKNGNSTLDALMTFVDPEGGFKHILNGNVDLMATEQGTYALVAYDRFINDENRLYDMTDLDIETGGETDKEAPVINLGGLAIEQTVEKGAEFTVPVLTASDNVDETVEVNWVITNDQEEIIDSIDTSVTGVYKITYSAEDTSGNKALPVIIIVNVKKSSGSPAEPAKAYITLSIDKLTIDKGYVLNPTGVEITKGESVWSALKRVLDERNIDYDYTFHEKYNSVYIESIAGDGEFDHGSGSGWMYNVNAWYPNYGASLYELEDGDVVQWRYTTNLGADLGEDVSLWEDSVKPGIPKEAEEPNDPNIPDEGSYTDVSLDDWFHNAVNYVTDKGLMEGIGDGKFAPNSLMTRSTLVTVLYRYVEEPLVEGINKFRDVSEDEWYTNAIIWASENGIVEGYGDGLFGTNDDISREQVATILMRFAKLQGLDTSKRADLSDYSDASKISSWAQDAMEWANAYNLIKGRSATSLAPQSTATRAEVATILQRFVEDFIR